MENKLRVKKLGWDIIFRNSVPYDREITNSGGG